MSDILCVNLVCGFLNVGYSGPLCVLVETNTWSHREGVKINLVPLALGHYVLYVL